jgi:4-hydroxybenzoate polyprenyltransferase
MRAILRKNRKKLRNYEGYDGGMPRKSVALALSTHPGPSVAVSIVTLGLGLAVGLDPLRLALLGLSMLAGQLSIGLSNDWLDADRDRAVGRLDKPISRGDISVGTVRAAAWITCAIAFALAAPLGWAAETALLLIVGTGWAYNLGLKKTAFSVVPYVLSFGALPAFATLSRPEPAATAPWSLAVGGLLGAAAHFANTLPDLDDDRATGVNGLPHRLGRRASSVLTYVLLLGASVTEVFGAGGFGFVPGDAGLAANILITIFGVPMALRATRLHFRLIILAALIDVVVLVFAGSRLLG